MSEPKTPTPTPAGDTYKGWVFKWTNYIKGYQRRWFVLSNGLLSYYRYASLENRKDSLSDSSVTTVLLHPASYCCSSQTQLFSVILHIKFEFALQIKS